MRKQTTNLLKSKRPISISHIFDGMQLQRQAAVCVFPWLLRLLLLLLLLSFWFWLSLSLPSICRALCIIDSIGITSIVLDMIIVLFQFIFVSIVCTFFHCVLLALFIRSYTIHTFNKSILPHFGIYDLFNSIEFY